MIQLEGVSKVYRRGENAVYAIRNIDLEITSGLFVVITGPSGSGKSTLLYLMGCLETPTAGRILLDGKDLASLPSNARAEVRGRGIGFVFQSFHLIPNLSALENVELPMLLRGMKRAAARRLAWDGLEKMGLGNRLGHRPSELSGGEQQRVAIARAIINDPSIVLADEPTGNLDTEAGAQVFALLKQLKNEGRTPVVVTHNPQFAKEAESLVCLRDGQRDISAEQGVMLSAI